MRNGQIVESEVTGHNKGGLLVDFGRLTGFVPNSHVPQLRSCLGDHQELARQKGQMIGSELMLNVIDVNPKRKRLVLSAKEAEKERRQQQLREFEEGEVVRGIVVHIVDFGAFVEVADQVGRRKRGAERKRIDCGSPLLHPAPSLTAAQSGSRRQPEPCAAKGYRTAIIPFQRCPSSPKARRQLLP